MKNYPNTPILDDDIKKLTGRRFFKSCKYTNKLDILDDSPPCSAFSVAE